MFPPRRSTKAFGVACGAHTAVRTFRTAVFFLVLVLPVSAQEPGQAYTVRVQSVIGGGTYDVRVSEEQSFTVRLRGTNAPETSQPCGTDATARARKFLAVYPRVCGATNKSESGSTFVRGLSPRVRGHRATVCQELGATGPSLRVSLQRATVCRRVQLQA